MTNSNNRHIQISDKIISSCDVKSEELFVLAVIKYNNPTGTASVSITSILEQIHMAHKDSRNRTKIKKALISLESINAIEIFKDQSESIKISASDIKPSTSYFIKPLDCTGERKAFTKFDSDIFERFMSFNKNQKFGIFAIYASIVSSIYETDSSDKVSWKSQRTLSMETGVSIKTVSKLIYMLKEELHLINFAKIRFTSIMNSGKKDKPFSVTHSIYWKNGETKERIDVGISNAMYKMGYSTFTHYVQWLDKNNNVIEEGDLIL